MNERADMFDGETSPMRPIFASSSKMNFTPSQTHSYLGKLLPLIADVHDREVTVLPSFTSLPVAQEMLKQTGITWGGQDVHPEDMGAHTGETSARMLADLGCTYAMVGHAERRRDHAETNDLIGLKAAAALRWGVRPILCVGELTRQSMGRAMDDIRAQLEPIGGANLDGVVIAYEPLWAIGSGSSADPSWVESIHSSIHEWLRTNGANSTGHVARVAYGGSVTPAAAPELLSTPGVDGLFVGSASLDPLAFAKIVRMPLTVGER